VILARVGTKGDGIFDAMKLTTSRKWCRPYSWLGSYYKKMQYRRLASKSPKGLLMDILSDGKTFWLIMLCLFVFVALVPIGTVWMVVPIVLAICVLVMAIKFGWATIERESE
jgi:hypothetical protein